MNTSNQRKALREKLRTQRSQVTPAQRIVAAENLASGLEQLPEFSNSSHIAGYWAISGELSLHAVVARLLARKQTYYLPKVYKERKLTFISWHRGETLIPNRYGIPEPDANKVIALVPQLLDIVLVPLIGFDRRGHRLGTGGGFYDTTFGFLREQSRPTKPLLIGIGYSHQEMEKFEPAPWDVSLDFIATEHELIRCTL